MKNDDVHLNTFFTAIPLAKILCAIMEGTYENPDYIKHLKEQGEISGNERFRKMYRGEPG